MSSAYSNAAGPNSPASARPTWALKRPFYHCDAAEQLWNVLKHTWGDRTPRRIAIVWLYERAAAGEIGWGVMCTTASGKIVYPKVTSTLEELIPVDVLVGQAYGQPKKRILGPRRIVDAARKKNPTAGKFLKINLTEGAPFVTLNSGEAFCGTCNLFYETEDVEATIATVRPCETDDAKSEETPAIVLTPAQEIALVIELAAEDWKENPSLTRRELFDRIAGDDLRKRAPCAKDRVWRIGWTFYRFKTDVTKQARALAGLASAKRGPHSPN